MSSEGKRCFAEYAVRHFSPLLDHLSRRCAGTLQEEAEVTRQRRAIAAMARRLQPASAAAAPAAQLPALPAVVGGAAMDIAAVADPAGGEPLTPAETRFSARLGPPSQLLEPVCQLCHGRCGSINVTAVQPLWF